MSKRKQGAPKSEPKPKLRTMNEISAAEAVELFLKIDLFKIKPENFPQDIAAWDFFECYERSWKPVAIVAHRQPEKQQGQQPDVCLTRVERKVFPLLQKGLQDKEIATELKKGLGTIKAHVRSILKKLNKKSRKELVCKATQRSALLF